MRKAVKSAFLYVSMSRTRDPRNIHLMEPLDIKILRSKFRPGKEELEETDRLEEISTLKEEE